MNKYGLAALAAVRFYVSGKFESPIDAWEHSTINYFGRGTASQKKGCPRDTFLGLCEEGLIVDIPKGDYTNSIKNKAYGIRAVEILKSDTSYLTDPKGLWKMVIRGQNKVHNSQMDVVISLWEKGLICR